MKLVGAEFKDRVDYYSQSWWPARELIVNALDKRHEVLFEKMIYDSLASTRSTVKDTSCHTRTETVFVYK